MEDRSHVKSVLPFVVVLMIISTLSMNAQVLRTYGLKVGTDVAGQQWDYSPAATLSGALGVPSSSIWGFDVGAFAEFLNVPYFSLLTEVHYTQKGRTVTILETVPANNPQGYVEVGLRDITQRLHYVSIPVMAKLRIESEVLTPFIALGPSFEYLIAYPPSPVTDQFNKAELAIAVAAGLEISLGFTPKILAEVRYIPSLTNTYKTEFVTVNNHVVEILVGISF